MQWLRKLRNVEWIASLSQMVWGLCKRAWKHIASAGGVSMSSLMGWLPDWLTVFFVALAFLFAFTVVEKFVKKIRERKRQPTIETKEESQQKKSNSEKPGEMFGSAVVQVRSANDERDQYRTEADEKAKELTKLRAISRLLSKSMACGVFRCAALRIVLLVCP